VTFTPPGDPNDPKQALAWAIESFVSNGVTVPIPPKAIPEFAAQLHGLGLRWAGVEAMTLFPAPVVQTQMGWLAPAGYISREEYEKRTAESAAAADTPAEAESAAGMDAQMLALLTTVDPNLAKQIVQMTPEEKAEMFDELKGKAPDAIKNIEQIRKTIEES
jgi:hypothetical protein